MEQKQQTVDQQVKLMLGDLIVQNVALQTQVAELSARIQEMKVAAQTVATGTKPDGHL